MLCRHQREKRICSWLQIFRVSKSCLHHNLTQSQTNLCHTLYKHRILPSDSKSNKHVYNIRTNVFLVKASLQARKKKHLTLSFLFFVNFVRNDWYHCMVIVNIIFISYDGSALSNVVCRRDTWPLPVSPHQWTSAII